VCSPAAVRPPAAGGRITPSDDPASPRLIEIAVTHANQYNRLTCTFISSIHTADLAQGPAVSGLD